MKFRLVPVTSLHPDSLPDLKRVLAYAVGKTDETHLSRLLADTYSQPQRKLLALMDGSKVVGVLGFERRDAVSAVLLHLAVAPAYRKQGLGRYLLVSMVSADGISRLDAETDDDAVGFYRRCGFRIQSLGEKYPGVARYLCTWERADIPSAD